jgi:TonB-dependent receptor
LLAYYASVSLPLKKVNLAGGVRVENNKQSLQSYQTNGTGVDQNVKVNRVLPSMNISYNFSEKMLIRGTYGQTLNRPEFREIAPFGFYDFEYNWVITGNPNLKTAKVNNYDIRWELYPSKTEMITVGAFYKDFADAIEMHYKVGSGSISTFDFQNASSAFNYGVEIDMRKSLQGLTGSKLLDKMNLLFNAAIIKSEVQVDNQPKRQLMGQSPYVINAGAYYNDDEKGLQISVLYNVAGRRLFAVGGYTDAGVLSYDNIYEMPRNVLDFSVSKTFKEKLQVKFSVSDILNQEYVLLQDGDSNGEFSKTKDQVIQSNRYGSLYTLGLSYKIW